MNIELEKMDLIGLKALAYDLIHKMEQASSSLKRVNEEIEKKEKDASSKPT